MLVNDSPPSLPRNQLNESMGNNNNNNNNGEISQKCDENQNLRQPGARSEGNNSNLKNENNASYRLVPHVKSDNIKSNHNGNKNDVAANNDNTNNKIDGNATNKSRVNTFLHQNRDNQNAPTRMSRNSSSNNGNDVPLVAMQHGPRARQPQQQAQ